MKLEKHKKEEVNSTLITKVSSIQELAINFVGSFITACEGIYGKDAMTEGTIPCAELIKASIKMYVSNNVPYPPDKIEYTKWIDSILKDSNILEKEYDSKN